MGLRKDMPLMASTFEQIQHWAKLLLTPHSVRVKPGKDCETGMSLEDI